MTEPKLRLQLIDPRTLRLGDAAYVQELNELSEIVRLTKPNTKIEITAGSTVRYKDVPYRVNIITPGKAGDRIVCYDLRSSLLTTSSIFITPLLGFSKSELLWQSNLINTFLSTTQYDECIAILYRFSGHRKFLEFEDWVRQLPTFMAQVEVDPYQVLYVFSVPSHAKSNYRLIRQGKYSEIDDFAKLIILSFHGFDRTGQTGKILYKDPSLREELERKLDFDIGDAELHSIPDLKNERFNLDYYTVNDKRENRTAESGVQKGSME